MNLLPPPHPLMTFTKTFTRRQHATTCWTRHHMIRYSKELKIRHARTSSSRSDTRGFSETDTSGDRLNFPIYSRPTIIPSWTDFGKISNCRVFEKLNSSEYREGRKKHLELLRFMQNLNMYMPFLVKMLWVNKQMRTDVM